MEEVMEKIGAVIFFVLIVISFFFVIDDVLENNDKTKCFQWQRWSKEISKDHFNPTEEMKTQCEQLGIKISD